MVIIMTGGGQAGTKIRESLEKRLRRQGIPLPRDLTEESPGIIKDEQGRYWKFNEHRTMRWRVDEYGNDLTLKNRADKINEEFAQWQHLINNEKDPEVLSLLREEELYDGAGGSANQWARLDKKKEDIRKQGKLLPVTPADLRRRIAESSSSSSTASAEAVTSEGEDEEEEERQRWH